MFCMKKATFEISQNILNPYTNEYVLWRHKWDGPPT